MHEAGKNDYKKFVDGLTRLAASVEANRILEGQPLVADSPKKTAEYNALLGALPKEVKAMFAELLHEAQSSGIHDTLVYLESGGYSLVGPEGKLPYHPFGTEIFFDYVARLAGDPWPE